MKKLILAALGGVAVGVTAGYFGTRKLLVKTLTETYEEELNREIAKTTAFLNEKYKADTLELVNTTLEQRDGPARSPLDDVDSDVPSETLERVVEALRYGPSVPVGPAQPALPAGSQRKNVFDKVERKKYETRPPTDEPPKVEDRPRKGSGLPYIISQEQYAESEDGYAQVTLTYFAEDNTLSDEEDKMVDVDSVGAKNLEFFGHKSGDSRVVYVRDDNIDVDYEILLHDGSYAEVVAGEVKYERPRV